MPEMDGLTMCEKAFAQGLFTGKFVFMITTESSSEMKSRGKEAGVKAWLTKPVNMEKVQAAIVKLLG
jgi:two-component system chemotaxis response regulator CheY